MAKKLANGDDIFRVEGHGDQLYTIGEAGIYKYDSNSLKGFDRSKASDYSVLSSVDTENLFKSIVDEGSKRYNIDSDYGGYGNEAGVGGLGNRVSMAQATSYLGRSPLGTLPTRAQEIASRPELQGTPGDPNTSATSSQYPGAGQTVGDLFTNPSNGATYNWRTGALVNDPSGQAIARGQGGSNNPIPQAQAPGNAGGITTGIGSANMPTNSPTFGNPSGAIAGTSGMGTMLDTLMKQNADNEKARVAEVAKQDKANQSMLDKLLGSTVSPTKARNDAQSETGINPQNYFAEEKAKIAEIGTLTEEYNATKAAMEQQIALTYDKLGSNNFINNQQAQITRNAAPKLNMMSANINSKAAVLQALQGRFAEAQDYVRQAVSDATADTKYKMDIFTTFYQMNQDSIDRLDSIYKDAFNTSMSLAQTAYDQELKEKTMIGNLMIDPNYAGAGVSINDTLEQAQVKVQGFLNSQPTLTSGGSGSNSSGNSSGGSGGGTTSSYKFTATQLNGGANKAGMSSTEFAKLNPDVQNFFVSSSPTQVSDMITAAKTDKDAISLIDSSNLTPAVKEYMKSLVPKSNTAPKTGGIISSIGNAASSVWNGITSLFGFKSNTGSSNYQVKSGDTLSKIASNFGTTVTKLQSINPSIKDVNKISLGQVINLP